MIIFRGMPIAALATTVTGPQQDKPQDSCAACYSFEQELTPPK